MKAEVKPGRVEFKDICDILDLGGDFAVGYLGVPPPSRRTSDPTQIVGGKATTTFIPRPTVTVPAPASPEPVPTTTVAVAPTAEAEDIQAKVKSYLDKGFFLINPRMTEMDYNMEKPNLDAAYAEIVTFVHPGEGTRSGKFLSVLGKPKPEPKPADTTPQQPTEMPTPPQMIPPTPPLPPGAMAVTPTTAFSPAAIFTQIQTKWNALSQTQKIIVIGGGVAAVALVAFLILRSRQQDIAQGVQQ